MVKIPLLEEVCMNNGNIPLSCDKRRHQARLTKRKMNAQYSMCLFCVRKSSSSSDITWLSQHCEHSQRKWRGHSGWLLYERFS